MTRGEKSLYIGAGPALATENTVIIYPEYQTAHGITFALRADCQGLWGLTDRFALTGKLGTSVTLLENGSGYFYQSIHPCIGLGLQYEFLENPSFAVKFDLTYPILPVSISFLADINSPKLDRGIATLGLILSLDGPLQGGMYGLSPFPLAPTLFINARPTPRFCIYAGVTPYPPLAGSYETNGYFECTLGIGYKIF